jgi:hypothetical protein
MSDNSAILRSIGRAIYGDQWQPRLAADLIVNTRTIRDWLANDRLPPGIKVELIKLAQRHAVDFSQKATTLQRAAKMLEGSQILPVAPQSMDTVSVTAPNGWLFTDFKVIPTGSWGDPEIRCIYNGVTVLATVTREAWEDFFRMPGDARFTSNEARMLAQANLGRLAPVIADKYSRGEYETIGRSGSAYPLITLFEGDLRRAGPGMTQEILSMARASGSRFAVGQKYVGKSPPHRTAEVAQIEDEGRKAWVDVRDPDGSLKQSDWVTHAQFINYWSLSSVP